MVARRDAGELGEDLDRPRVEDGDVVSKGDAIATIEAMKMESSVKAPRDGQISLAAQQGERVKANAAIATIS